MVRYLILGFGIGFCCTGQLAASTFAITGDGGNLLALGTSMDVTTLFNTSEGLLQAVYADGASANAESLRVVGEQINARRLSLIGTQQSSKRDGRGSLFALFASDAADGAYWNISKGHIAPVETDTLCNECRGLTLHAASPPPDLSSESSDPYLYAAAAFTVDAAPPVVSPMESAPPPDVIAEESPEVVPDPTPEPAPEPPPVTKRSSRRKHGVSKPIVAAVASAPAPVAAAATPAISPMPMPAPPPHLPPPRPYPSPQPNAMYFIAAACAILLFSQLRAALKLWREDASTSVPSENGGDIRCKTPTRYMTHSWHNVAPRLRS